MNHLALGQICEIYRNTVLPIVFLRFNCFWNDCFCSSSGIFETLIYNTICTADVVPSLPFINRQRIYLVTREIPIVSAGRSTLLVSAYLHGYTASVTSQARPSGCRIQSDVDEWSRPLMDDGVTLSGCPDEHRAPVIGGQIPGSHRIVFCCREDLNILTLIGYNTVYRSVSAWFFYKTKLTCFHYIKETHEDMQYPSL